MATALTDIFGSDIKVTFNPRKPLRQYSSYPGAHGATSLLMGSAGYPIIVTGQLRVTGASYAAARIAMVTLLEAVESWAWAAEQTFTYYSETYQYVVLDQVDTHLDKLFRYTSEGVGVLPFTATFRSLL